MNHVLHFFLLLHRLALTSAAENPPVASPSTACSDKLVAFSTCLPYVALAPNNVSASPPPQCCSEVSAAFSDGSAICLCYIVLRPKILGFPLNSTKVLSLTSVCPLKDRTDQAANRSLRTLCSKSAALPPLHSITGSKNPTLPNFGSAALPPLHSITGSSDSTDSGNSALPNFGTAQESSGNSSTEKSPAPVSSSAARMLHGLSWTWLCFPVFLFTAS